ncbi:MAG: hypothetical protein HY719_01890 [Planctomycetes bacterium]|nr:hypothetical protein [Planctomycetota bacterium]
MTLPRGFVTGLTLGVALGAALGVTLLTMIMWVATGHPPSWVAWNTPAQPPDTDAPEPAPPRPAEPPAPSPGPPPVAGSMAPGEGPAAPGSAVAGTGTGAGAGAGAGAVAPMDADDRALAEVVKGSGEIDRLAAARQAAAADADEPLEGEVVEIWEQIVVAVRRHGSPLPGMRLNVYRDGARLGAVVVDGEATRLLEDPARFVVIPFGKPPPALREGDLLTAGRK